MHLLERGVLFSVLFLFSSMNDIQEVCTRNLLPKLIAIERNRWVIMCLLRPNIIATRRTTADPCSWNRVYGFNCQLRTLKCTSTNEKQRGRVSSRLYVSSRLCCIFYIFQFQRTRSPKGFLNCSQRRENITGSFNTYTGIFNKVSSISNRFTCIALMLQIGILFTWNFQSKLKVNWKQTLSRGRGGIRRSDIAIICVICAIYVTQRIHVLIDIDSKDINVGKYTWTRQIVSFKVVPLISVEGRSEMFGTSCESIWLGQINELREKLDNLHVKRYGIEAGTWNRRFTLNRANENLFSGWNEFL